MLISPQHFLVLLILTLFKEGFSNSVKRYNIGNTENWFQANEKCRAMGLQLATIQSFEENSALAQFVQGTDKFAEDFNAFWIGGSDLADEGTFTWFATGRLITYENWSPGEPNNNFFGKDEDCMQFVYYPAKNQSWTWNDNHCMMSFRYICENVASGCVDEF